jgi:Na+-translocating ferredoxin:NAD+ oxidoreductase RNF subunit RnfB
MDEKIYKRLAERLDALPHGFPSTDDGAELRILAYLFTPEEADLAVQLRATPETAEEIAERIGGDVDSVGSLLKGLARKSLITARRVDGVKGFCLMPFAVGFYEEQGRTMDEELARLFEDYMEQAFQDVLKIEPQLHRVVPVNETIKTDMEVHPYESIVDIVATANAWCVFDCICRKQKVLVGDPCEHPVDICMAFSEKPGAFDGSSYYKAVTQEEAVATLQRASDAGLVHSVSNSQEEIGYICNCCTCSCNMMRGIADMGMSNVVARSAFVNEVDEVVCNGCETCLDYCQFDALSIEDGIAVVNKVACVGCGVCVPSCDTEALALARRPEEEVLQIPVTEEDWLAERAEARGIDLDIVR